MSYIWLAGVVVFAIMEAATVSINFVWFAFGSLSAMIAAMCGAQLWLQLVVFVAVTGFALYFTKPLVKKYLQGKHQRAQHSKQDCLPQSQSVFLHFTQNGCTPVCRCCRHRRGSRWHRSLPFPHQSRWPSMRCPCSRLRLRRRQ